MRVYNTMLVIINLNDKTVNSVSHYQVIDNINAIYNFLFKRKFSDVLSKLAIIDFLYL